VKTGYDGTKCEDDYADAYLIKADDHDDHDHDDHDDEETVKDSAAGVLGVMSAALLLHA